MLQCAKIVPIKMKNRIDSLDKGPILGLRSQGAWFRSRQPHQNSQYKSLTFVTGSITSPFGKVMLPSRVRDAPAGLGIPVPREFPKYQ